MAQLPGATTVAVLTHDSVCEARVLLRDSTTLLCSCEADGRTLWCFDEQMLPREALSLCSVALKPLHELEVSAAEARWLGASDPWDGPLAAQLGAWLSTRTAVQPSVPAATTTAAADTDVAVEADDAIELRHDRHTGRGLYLRRGCAAGQLLLRETAFAAVLRRGHATARCSLCLSPLGRAPVRCAACAERYCSTACRARACARGHAVECGLRYAAVAPVTALMAVRALLASPPPAQRGAAAGGAAAGGAGWARVAAHEACGALESHAERLEPARLSRLRLQARLAWRSVGAALEARGQGEAALLRLLCQAETNTFAISALLPLSDAAEGAQAAAEGGPTAAAEAKEAQEAAPSAACRVAAARVGEGIFPFAAMLNHACEPNTALVFRGRVLELRACRAVERGEQLWGCYGPQVGHAPRAARRQSLREQYFFACACAACAAEQQGGAASRREAEAERAVAAAAALDERAFEACERSDYAGAARLVAQAVAQLRRVFPPESSQVAHEMVKLGKLRFNAAPDAEAARRLREAAAALSACCGADEPEVAELQRLAAMCEESACNLLAS